MTKPFSYTEALRVLGAETPAIRRMDPISAERCRGRPLSVFHRRWRCWMPGLWW